MPGPSPFGISVAQVPDGVLNGQFGPPSWLSSYRSEELHDLIAAGLPFLEKPFTVDGLKRKVREVLEGP